MKHLRVNIETYEQFKEKGERSRDFCHANDGELLVLPSFVCEGGADFRERCGCGRAFTGIGSTKGCTIGVVEDWLEEQIREEFTLSPLVESWTSAGLTAEEMFTELVGTLSNGLANFHVGDAVRINHGEGEFILYSADSEIMDQI